MTLDVGNLLRIENPTADVVRQHLRNLSLEAPFMILSADEERFIQAKPHSGDYRVEWHDEGELRHALVTFERAEELLLAFLRRDDAALRGGEWHVLRWFNDPYYGLVATAVLVAAILLIIFAAEVWHMVR
jgi:hypothetical protein